MFSHLEMFLLRLFVQKQQEKGEIQKKKGKREKNVKSKCRRACNSFTCQLLAHTVNSMVLLLLSNKPLIPLSYNRKQSPSATSI